MTKSNEGKINDIKGLFMGYERDGYDGNFNNVMSAFIFYEDSLNSLVKKYGDGGQKASLLKLKEFIENNKDTLGPLFPLLQKFSEQKLGEKSFAAIESFLKENPTLIDFIHVRIDILKDIAVNLGKFARFAPAVSRGAKVTFGEEEESKQPEVQAPKKSIAPPTIVPSEKPTKAQTEEMSRQEKINNIIGFVKDDVMKNFLKIVIKHKNNLTSITEKLRSDGKGDAASEMDRFHNIMEKNLKKPTDVSEKFYQVLQDLVEEKQNGEQQFRDFFSGNYDLLTALNGVLRSMKQNGCAESVVQNSKSSPGQVSASSLKGAISNERSHAG